MLGQKTRTCNIKGSKDLVKFCLKLYVFNGS